MAAGGPVKDLCDEASCPICLDYFKDPVTITECGHNFCQACLTQYWGESETDVSCPQCRVRGRSFKPNRQLVNIVEIAKKLQGTQALAGGKEAEGKGRVCEKHQETLKLFCKDHETPICVVCDRSKDHRNHSVIPLEEAFIEYKDRIHCSLEDLRKERENILSYQTDTAKQKQVFLEQTEYERQKTVAVFRELHQFLEEKEKHLLAQMEEVEKATVAFRDKQMDILSQELTFLERQIQEMEEKLQQPADGLLQDIRSTLEKCQKKEHIKMPESLPPALKWRVWELCDINPFLKGALKQFKATLESGLQLQKANVTLDGNTAHPRLILSDNNRSIKTAEKCQDVPNNPERFDKWTFVLACEGFTSGCHCWEVLVGTEGAWCVGVARKSVTRKGNVTCTPKGGIWLIRYLRSEYEAYVDSGLFSLSLSWKPRKIRVILSCERGLVSFFDADTAAQIYTFSGVSFGGEILLPLFYLDGEGHLTLTP